MTDRASRVKSFAARRTTSLGTKCRWRFRGLVLPGGLKIKVGKLRGVESEGMLCSAKELGLADDAEGLLILPKEAPVGKPFRELYPADTIFELEITPNRPDWLSHVGLAREVAAFSGRRLHPLRRASRRSEKRRRGIVSVQAPASVSILFGPPDSRRESRAKSAVASRPAGGGRLRPINNIVDITNYVMLELGQPLHAFDAGKVHGGIIVRHGSPWRRFPRAGWK